MEWKLGVAMSSSTCRSLNAPYLTLQLRLGQENTHTLDMTLPEFQVRGWRGGNVEGGGG